MSRCGSDPRRRPQSDEDFVFVVVVDEEEDDDEESLDDVDALDSFDDVEPLDSFDEEELSAPFDEFDESLDAPGGVLACDPRLSVLKKPEPLNVTPTGWNTFLTGRSSPEPGWVYSVSVSSVNACWTSMVSPEAMNL